MSFLHCFIFVIVSAAVLYFDSCFFLQYIEKDYSILVEVLEPLISVKAKEELATCMVNILHKNGHAKDYLADIVMAEVDKLGEL